MSGWMTLQGWLNNPKRLFYFFGLATLFSVFLSVWIDFVPIVFLPLGLVVVYVALVDYPILYRLLFFLIPFSVELYLPGGLGTDLPSEPFMLIITFIFFLELIQHPKIMHRAFFSHPLSLMVYAHLGWILITAITSQNLMVSFKFLLAKVWYVIPFYFMASIALSRKMAFDEVVKWLLVGLIGAVTYVFIRHAMVGFSFAEVHFIVGPFFRNHVTYGSLICILIPFAWYYWRSRKSSMSSAIWFLAVLFLIGAMYFSYTRATYIAFLGAVGAYFVIRWKLTRWMILLSIVTTLFIANDLLENNRYLDFAPDYNKTITHTEFESLIDATAKGEDISTMERVYRWVAGMNMIRERFFLGFGSGNFYFFYKPYAESAFKTYVSNNPDKSGIHSYFLMTFVEQGIIGFLIFLAMSILALMVGERAYHLARDRLDKIKVMACVLCLIQILLILIINDLIESDKVGPFFFFSAAVIVLMDLKGRKLGDA